MNQKQAASLARREWKILQPHIWCGNQVFSSAILGFLSVLSLALGFSVYLSAAPIHTTYLWHMHQPIYWPDRSTWYPSRYETAYETITLGHSQSDVFAIFNKDDRVGDYQTYPKDAISMVLDLPDAGAQISFAGALIENVKSLADNGWNGGRYAPNWYSHYRTARSWTTSGGHSRMPQLLVAAHHPIAPLMDEKALEREIQVAKVAYQVAWGDTNFCRGYFPAETCFSERMIPVLVRQGIQWVIVADIHISRACANYPYLANEDNCDPPNSADKLNPAQTYYESIRISRGVTVKVPPPFGFRPHYVRYVDPETGTPYQMIAVPASNAMSWNEGYAMYGTGEIDRIAPYNDPNHPMLIVFAHDGDNDWAGGYSYYHENVTSFCHQAASKGYEPTTIEEYLADHPISPTDIVHVEDGGWVNADGDFGSPQFINWNWPLVDASGNFDIPNGWAEDERNWAVLTAAQNRVETAEQMMGIEPNPSKIFDPTTGANNVEKAWHHLLSGYESGYMYYGTALDMEVKATLAANAAVYYADQVIQGGTDQTPPTIWLPQRLPWNPGGRGGGSLWGYPSGEGKPMPSDFWVWTFVYDVSGVARVDFKYRIDYDGLNPLSSDENETYAGGPGVGPWQVVAMTRRVFPKGNYFNDPNIDFFVLPQYIADEYYVHITNLSEVLIDYYVEAEDSLGNIKRSPIQHVWIGPRNVSPTHKIDGNLDSNCVHLASNAGLDLYADWDGELLYVATQGVSRTSNWDHFIIIGVDLSNPVGAPWAKSGTVAQRKLYLGNENDNNWCGWFDEFEHVLSDGVERASGQYLEGTIRLASYLGSPLPDEIYLAVGAYLTPDGGSLQAQVPAGDGDQHIQASEYCLFSLSNTRVVPEFSSSFPLRISPNPSPGGFEIAFTLDKPSQVTIRVYDVWGREVALVARGFYDSGENCISWGYDRGGLEKVEPGIYFFKVSAGDKTSVSKFVLLR